MATTSAFDKGVRLSVVSPVYNAADLVSKLVEMICAAASTLGVPFEVILVEDGSCDDSWKAICAAAALNDRVRGIKLSRNFGQHAAITAGLASAHGDYIAVIDCDLQENPAYIPLLFRKAEEGYDIVYTTRAMRKHPWLKRVTANLYYWTIRWLSDSVSEGRGSFGTYSMISRRVVTALLRMKDVHRHYILMLQWTGFNSTCMEIEHEERPSGVSAYTFRKLLRHAIDGIVSQSTKLLTISVIIGSFISILAFVSGVLLVVLYFVHGFKEGWASLAVLILFCTGCLLCSIGAASLYISKIFEQSRQRPIYLIDRTTSDGSLDERPCADFTLHDAI